MGGSAIENDLELTSQSNGLLNLVLFGRTGNGKSSTGNSIIGNGAFESRFSFSGVTRTCEMQQTILKDGQIVNVIDTPGLFDSSIGSEFVGKEIVKCIGMAKEGIHAVLVVFSARNRFSKEEEEALRILQTLFGRKIIDYMIVVFTGGDVHENIVEILDECPEPLKEILQQCKNRRVLFDNVTKDDTKRTEQVQKLLSLVNSVIVENGGQPYTDDMLFAELKKGAAKLCHQQVEVDYLKGNSKQLKEQMRGSYEEQLFKRLAEMVESSLKERAAQLEQQLTEEQSKRKETTSRLEQLLAKEQMKFAKLIHKAKMEDEIRKLREELERAQKDLERAQKNAEKGGCYIL